MRNLIWYWGWSDIEDRRYWLKWFSRIFAEIGQCIDECGSLKPQNLRSSWKRVQRSLIKVWLRRENILCQVYLFWSIRVGNKGIFNVNIYVALIIVFPSSNLKEPKKYNIIYYIFRNLILHQSKLRKQWTNRLHLTSKKRKKKLKFVKR